jgi:hypothetical protein
MTAAVRGLAARRVTGAQRWTSSSPPLGRVLLVCSTGSETATPGLRPGRTRPAVGRWQSDRRSTGACQSCGRPQEWPPRPPEAHRRTEGVDRL